MPKKKSKYQLARWRGVKLYLTPAEIERGRKRVAKVEKERREAEQKKSLKKKLLEQHKRKSPWFR